MINILNNINSREQYLKNLLEQLNLRIAQAPAGTLRISSSHKKDCYYYRDGNSNHNGKYLSKKNMTFIRQLAQRDYDLEVQKAIHKELDAIHTFKEKLPATAPEKIWESKLSSHRKPLVEPIILPDSLFVKQWEDEPNPGKPFPNDFPDYYTDRGERVRSKSEILIANQLLKYEIPYKYECPLYLKGFGYVHPDFTVMNIKKRKILYWEHQGLMDKPEYATRAFKKEFLYIKNHLFPGDKLILTSETEANPLDTRYIVKIIEKYLVTA